MSNKTSQSLPTSKDYDIAVLEALSYGDMKEEHLLEAIDDKFLFTLCRCLDCNAYKGRSTIQADLTATLARLHRQNRIKIDNHLWHGVKDMSILGHLTNPKDEIFENLEEQFISFWLNGFATKVVPGQDPQKNIRRLSAVLVMTPLIIKATPYDKMPSSLSVYTTTGLFLGWVPRSIQRVISQRLNRIETGEIIDFGDAWPGSPHIRPRVQFSYNNGPKVDHFLARALSVVK